ncbi:MAG: hypothetical protein IJV31_04070, partial [Clostridia bacterium]|nr:hypothetical protein [Clostridia bacterium]
ISKLLEFIDLSNYDFDKLYEIGKIFKQKLLKFKQFTDMSDERIEKLYNGLEYRIKLLASKKKS